MPLSAIVLAGNPDRDARLILLSALTHAGYRVRLASTGDELLREALGDGVDLILSEIRLPCAIGRCAIEALKRLPELQRIPVIAYSESGTPGDEAWAHSVGADAFLRKPTNVAVLLDTVAAMRLAGRPEESRSRVGPSAARDSVPALS